MPMIPTLEEETGVPVITSMHALVSAACRMGHVRSPHFRQHGRLFHTLAPASAQPKSLGRAGPAPVAVHA